MPSYVAGERRLPGMRLGANAWYRVRAFREPRVPGRSQRRLHSGGGLAGSWSLGGYGVLRKAWEGMLGANGKKKKKKRHNCYTIKVNV